jgi:predicted DNA-binding mobile mystery protein A
MTLKDLSSRVGVSPAAISKLESRELEGKVTLESLNKVAQAIDCTLIYSIVPNQDIEKVIRAQARSKALGIINRANVHMELEDQAVKSKLNSRVDRLAGELIDKGDIW